MNKINIIGNLTRDPELRKVSANGGEVSVCSFTVAVNKKKGDGADFFRVSAWRGLGESCARYLKKGRKVYVSGPLSLRTFQGQDGNTTAVLEVTADEVEFLTSLEKGDAFDGPEEF